MSISKRLPRKSAAAIAIIAALAFAGIASASASAAKWVQGNTTMKWKASTITLKKSGGSPVTCTWGSVNGKGPLYGAQNVGSPPTSAMGAVANFNSFYTSISCENKTTFVLCSCIKSTGKGTGGVYSAYLTNWWPGAGLYASPYGSYSQEGTAVGTFTNGSGGTPSTLSFNEKTIGRTYPGFEPITMTATFEVSDEAGGLLTLED